MAAVTNILIRNSEWSRKLQLDQKPIMRCWLCLINWGPQNGHIFEDVIYECIAFNENILTKICFNVFLEVWLWYSTTGPGDGSALHMIYTIT